MNILIVDDEPSLLRMNCFGGNGTTRADWEATASSVVNGSVPSPGPGSSLAFGAKPGPPSAAVLPSAPLAILTKEHNIPGIQGSFQLFRPFGLKLSCGAADGYRDGACECARHGGMDTRNSLGLEDSRERSALAAASLRAQPTEKPPCPR